MRPENVGFDRSPAKCLRRDQQTEVTRRFEKYSSPGSPHCPKCDDALRRDSSAKALGVQPGALQLRRTPTLKESGHSITARPIDAPPFPTSGRLFENQEPAVTGVRAM